MQLDSTLATIAQQIPETLDNAVNHVANYIPEELQDIIWHASSYLPTEFDFVTVGKFLLYFAAASLILGVLGRIVLGKRSSLNHSLSSTMGILFLYALTVMIYTFKTWNLEVLLSPLPFVTFSGDYLIVLPITDSQFPALCTEILSLVILAFLLNLVDYLMPQGEYAISWLLLRFITIGICMVAHLAVRWGFETFLPEILVQYAPTVLLFLLVFMLLSGVINLILGLVIAVTNPFLGAMYTFFFSNLVGKQVSKAIFCSAILCGIFYVLDLFGYTVISISAAALITYIPVALIALTLWFIIGHVL